MRPGELRTARIPETYPDVLGVVVEWDILRNDGTVKGYFGGAVAFNRAMTEQQVTNAIRKFQKERREEWRGVYKFPTNFIAKCRKPILEEYADWMLNEA
jgi:hypothetical protein